MICDPWAVVVVPFPFTDKQQQKKRPALVVSATAFHTHHDHVILAMITSAKRSHWPTDVIIRDRVAAGLKAPSLVRFKLFTLDRRLILKQIGALAGADQTHVLQDLDTLLVQNQEPVTR